jgi:hypothetical protein
MAVRFEILISLLAIAVLFIAFSPLLIFLQDIGSGKIYAEFKFNTTPSYSLTIILHHEGFAYLTDVNFFSEVTYQNGLKETKNLYVSVFAKGDTITINIPLKFSYLQIEEIKVNVSAYIMGVYRIEFYLERK